MSVLDWGLVSFLWYQLISHFGISMGLHRYFAHRQFRVPQFFEYFILCLATLAGARSPIGWIAAHRMHHAYSDSVDDPHSPKHLGFWRVLFSQWSLESIPPRFSRDLFQSKSLVFFHKYWRWIWALFSIGSLFLGVEFFLAFVLSPALISYIGFGLVNGFCHRYGKAQNVPWVNLLTAGEGYHLEHHLDGKKWRFHRYDLTGVLIGLLMKISFVKK